MCDRLHVWLLTQLRLTTWLPSLTARRRVMDPAFKLSNKLVGAWRSVFGRARQGSTVGRVLLQRISCSGLTVEYWAPSSEFVSSSIPSWQISTAHAQPFRGATDMAFCLKVPHDSLLLWASSEGSGETARMRRLAWTFAARIGDKYQIRVSNCGPYSSSFISVLNLDIFAIMMHWWVRSPSRGSNNFYVYERKTGLSPSYYWPFQGDGAVKVYSNWLCMPAFC